MSPFTLFAFATLIAINGCSSNNEEKKRFIQKNIEKTNNKNIRKHGKLVIPDFLLEMQNKKENIEDDGQSF